MTADIKALAQSFGAEAIQTLVSIAQASESDQAKISAVKELLDRGYGKAVQAMEIAGKDGAPAVQIKIVKSEGK
ncbi:hypothetical protein [Paraburkholderia sp. BL9I2N2]|uniref:hypothetical protein n=1 Tax=Paraburkholderia sp. BL9I2N2 TaxID=1938809 RepID=UPI001A9F7671|nr:hypothetical protein [Paraburkholderia sp. BL9I2N2]